MNRAELRSRMVRALPGQVIAPARAVRGLSRRAMRVMAIRSGVPLARPLKASDVFLMHTAEQAAYDAYRPAMIVWGDGATPWQVHRLHRRNIRYIASVWALTAGAHMLATEPELAAAVARDLNGDPITVPWRADIEWNGVRESFGCTNHPRFREHIISNVRSVMASGADGLHVDDHLGVAQTVPFGGGFCDYCVEGFRSYLREHATPETLGELGIRRLEDFDYRDLIRRHTRDAADYVARRRKLPLAGLFERYHLDRAAEFTAHLGQVADEVSGRAVLLSANVVLPDLRHLVAVPALTHLVGEVIHVATSWRSRLPKPTVPYEKLFTAYRMADLYRRPLILTATMGDWAWVEATRREEMVRLWIALAYAHGHHFIVPAPDGQYVFDLTSGTNRYYAPIEAYAPVYAFIEENADWFDRFEATPVRDPGITGIRVTARRNPENGRVAVHLLDIGYDASTPVASARRNVTIALPPESPVDATAHLLHYDRDAETLDIVRRGSDAEVTIPEFRLWGVVAIEPKHRDTGSAVADRPRTDRLHRLISGG